METVRFAVEGMTCGACVNRITRAIRKLPGVVRVRVDLRRETATVTRDPRVVTVAALSEAVAAAGYAALADEARRVPDRESRGPVARLLNRVG